MKYTPIINLPLANHEVPNLREQVGWDRRDQDYPALFERCNFWAGVRNEATSLLPLAIFVGWA